MKKIYFVLLFSMSSIIVFSQVNTRKNAPPAVQPPADKITTKVEAKADDKTDKVTVANVETSIVKVEGSKANGNLKVTIGLKNIGPIDLKISSSGITVVDAEGNQLRPLGFSIDLLIKEVFTKDSFIVYKASPTINSLAVVKIECRISDPATRKAEIKMAEFRNVPIEWQ